MFPRRHLLGQAKLGWVPDSALSLCSQPVGNWQMRGFKSANSELQLHTGVGWGAEGELDEPSPLPQHRELTVNIRGNDIDFKELWLQMSLMFSLSLLRKKKNSSLCDLHSFLPLLLCSSIEENCPHRANFGVQRPQLL